MSRVEVFLGGLNMQPVKRLKRTVNREFKKRFSTIFR